MVKAQPRFAPRGSVDIHTYFQLVDRIFPNFHVCLTRLVVFTITSTLT